MQLQVGRKCYVVDIVRPRNRPIVSLLTEKQLIPVQVPSIVATSTTHMHPAHIFKHSTFHQAQLTNYQAIHPCIFCSSIQCIRVKLAQALPFEVSNICLQLWHIYYCFHCTLQHRLQLTCRLLYRVSASLFEIKI